MWIKEIDIEGYKFLLTFKVSSVNPIMSIEIDSEHHQFMKSLSYGLHAYKEDVANGKDVLTSSEEFLIAAARSFVKNIMVPEVVVKQLQKSGFTFVP